jgi:hypothetical protein
MSDKLRLGSIALLYTVLLLLPFITDSVNEEVARFVSDSESSHVGLPNEWDENQAICIYFPVEHPHPVYSSGVSMINADGSMIGVNYDLNLTGACVGGFEGYTDGMNFMMDATRVAGGHLAVGYSVNPNWGEFVHTIGGLNDQEVQGDFNGAYWSLTHNGRYSVVGIGSLVMEEGDVISWNIETW